MNRPNDIVICVVSFCVGAFLAVLWTTPKEPIVVSRDQECIEVNLYLNKSESMVVCGKVVDKPLKEWHAKDRQIRTNS